MPKLSEKGAIQFIVLLILLAGIIATVYLAQRTQIFKPKAGGGGPSAPIVAQTSFRFVSELFGQPLQAYVGREVADSVDISSDFDSANLFVAKIKFDKDLLQVSKIDTQSSSVIKNWIEQYYDNNIGEISLVGGIPDPGFQTQPGAPGGMATIYFVPLKEGKAELYFSDDSAIYRNSDNANILVVKGKTSITILSEGVPIPTASPTTVTTPTPTPIPTPVVTPKPGTGDGNNDGKIDLADMSVLLSNLDPSKKTIKKEVDMNGDGVINAFDFSLMRNLLLHKEVIKG